MNYRTLGKTGLKISEISLGTWQVGGKWGSGFDDKNALYGNLAALNIRNLSKKEMKAVEKMYREMIRPSVHHRW